MKELRIKHSELGENVLTLSIPTFGSKPTIKLNGQEIVKTKKVYSVTEQLGHPFEIKLKNSFFDPIPKVLVNDEPIRIVEPLKWYEYIWMGIPILLVLQGGALGAVLGFIALRVNSSIFRNQRKTLEKYLLSLGVNILVIGLFIVVATVVRELIGKN